MFSKTIAIQQSFVPDCYNINWKSQGPHILDGLPGNGIPSYVTLVCDGEHIHAHTLLLSLCSSYFRRIFQQNFATQNNTGHILVNVDGRCMGYLYRFMCHGNVTVPKSHLFSFMEAGRILEVHGFLENNLPTLLQQSTATHDHTYKPLQEYPTISMTYQPIRQTKGNEATQTHDVTCTQRSNLANPSIHIMNNPVQVVNYNEPLLQSKRENSEKQVIAQALLNLNPTNNQPNIVSGHQTTSFQAKINSSESNVGRHNHEEQRSFQPITNTLMNPHPHLTVWSRGQHAKQISTETNNLCAQHNLTMPKVDSNAIQQSNQASSNAYNFIIPVVSRPSVITHTQIPNYITFCQTSNQARNIISNNQSPLSQNQSPIHPHYHGLQTEMNTTLPNSTPGQTLRKRNTIVEIESFFANCSSKSTSSGNRRRQCKDCGKQLYYTNLSRHKKRNCKKIQIQTIQEEMKTLCLLCNKFVHINCMRLHITRYCKIASATLNLRSAKGNTAK